MQSAAHMIQVRKPVGIMMQQWNPPTGPKVTVSS
jgi:hypothetical protein